MEYAATIWDPYLQKHVDKLEKVQRQAVRFIAKDFITRTHGCVSSMLESHDLPTLQ